MVDLGTWFKMNQSVAIFSIQGSIWLNQGQQRLYLDNDIIEVINTRNHLKDWDRIGTTGGNCPDPGWYSLTLANIKNASANAVQIGDKLTMRILSQSNNQTIHDLGNYIVAPEDITMGGVVLEFDLGKEK